MVDLDAPDELRSAIELMYFAYRAFTSRADHILERRGLGRGHHRILYFVGRNPGITVKELLRLLRVSKQALNAPLRELTKRGLIRVEIPSRDRRVRELSLTGGGKRLESALTSTQMRQLAQVFAAAGREALGGWRKVMQSLKAGAAGTPHPRP